MLNSWAAKLKEYRNAKDIKNFRGKRDSNTSNCNGSRNNNNNHNDIVTREYKRKKNARALFKVPATP